MHLRNVLLEFVQLAGQAGVDLAGLASEVGLDRVFYVEDLEIWAQGGDLLQEGGELEEEGAGVEADRQHFAQNVVPDLVGAVLLLSGFALVGFDLRPARLD